MINVLLVDDNPHGLTRLEYQLSSITKNHRITAVTDPIEAVMLLRKGTFSMLFTNYRMSVMDGLSVARIANKVAPDMSVNIIANPADVIYIKSQSAYVMCSNLIAKPCEVSDLEHIIVQHQRYLALSQENTRLAVKLEALEKYSSLNLKQASCS